MPAIELVMCPRCKRPQPQGERCVQCGEALPAPLVDANKRPSSPRLRGELGDGRMLYLSSRHLEYRASATARPVQVALGEIAGVRLSVRPVYEALVFAAVFGGAAVFVGRPALRILLFAMAALAVLAVATQRQFSLVVQRKDGRRSALFWGIGAPGSPVGKRARSVWQSVAAELSPLGVDVGGPPPARNTVRSKRP